MKIKSIEDVVACRKYTLDTTTGKSEVEFVIGKPFSSPEVSDGMEYICPFSITLDGKLTFRFTAGIDALQSLLLALAAVRVELKTIANRANSSLSWFAGIPGAVDIHIPEFD